MKILTVSSVIFVNVFTFMVFSVNSIQNLYKYIPEHCEVKNINRSLVNFYMAKCTKLSRLDLKLNMNFSIHMDIINDNTAQIKITGYQFRSNEYRLGPIEFMMGLCSAIQTKQFDIPHMLSNSNTHRCPFSKKNNYYIYGLSPNVTNMPPLIPEGRWKLQLDFFYMNLYQILTIEWYYEITYPPLFTTHVY